MKNADATVLNCKPDKLWSKDYIFLMVDNFLLYFAGCVIAGV
jgi:hypothetical protein